MARYLGRLGFLVEMSSTAAGALDLFRAAPQTFSLAVVDLHLPDMRGSELGSRLCAINPDIRILYCTGDLFDFEHIPEELRERTSVLQKPFLPRDLAAEVERMLGAPGGMTATPGAS